MSQFPTDEELLANTTREMELLREECSNLRSALQAAEKDQDASRAMVVKLNDRCVAAEKGKAEAEARLANVDAFTREFANKPIDRRTEGTCASCGDRFGLNNPSTLHAQSACTSTLRARVQELEKALGEAVSYLRESPDRARLHALLRPQPPAASGEKEGT